MADHLPHNSPSAVLSFDGLIKFGRASVVKAENMACSDSKSYMLPDFFDCEDLEIQPVPMKNPTTPIESIPEAEQAKILDAAKASVSTLAIPAPTANSVPIAPPVSVSPPITYMPLTAQQVAPVLHADPQPVFKNADASNGLSRVTNGEISGRSAPSGIRTVRSPEVDAAIDQ